MEEQGGDALREDWEEQYKSGRWQYLHEAREMGRYALIASYIRAFTERPRVLDLGCGEGILAEYLEWVGIEHYVGLDVSPTAVAAAKVDPAKSTMIAADMQTHEFPARERFDAIVFNEVLSYPQAPMQVVDKYRLLLSPEGIVVVSMWHAPEPNSPYRRKCDAVWQALDSGPWKRLDEMAITKIPSGRVWRLRAMKRV